MKKWMFWMATVWFSCLLTAAPVCVDGVCYPSEEAALADGVSREKLAEAKRAEHAAGGPAETARPELAVSSADRTGARPRMATGLLKAEEMTRFLAGTSPATDLEAHAVWMILLLVFAGGLAANLTPCVLPLVPVNLSLVGKGAMRGAAYGLGITTAYGCLGLAAAFGGAAFGAIQSSPWFSLLAAVVFTGLALAVSEVFVIDLTRFRPRGKPPSRAEAGPVRAGLWKPFALGAWSAVLAGACVEPILIATLVLTAKWYAAGDVWAVALPFVLGAGMGSPWPCAAAGLAVLPKPGAWMRWVNRVFAVVLFGMAIWYGRLAWTGWQARRGPAATSAAAGQDAWIEATPATWKAAFEAARKTGKPVFVDVWATWCKNCLAMERTTFRDEKVRRALADFAVIRLQAEDFDALTRIPDLKGVPFKGLPAFLVWDVPAADGRQAD